MKVYNEGNVLVAIDERAGLMVDYDNGYVELAVDDVVTVIGIEQLDELSKFMAMRAHYQDLLESGTRGER